MALYEVWIQGNELSIEGTAVSVSDHHTVIYAETEIVFAAPNDKVTWVLLGEAKKSAR